MLFSNKYSKVSHFILEQGEFSFVPSGVTTDPIDRLNEISQVIDNGDGNATLQIKDAEISEPSALVLGTLTFEGIAFDSAMTSITDYVSEDAISIV